jgi:hypothetical protein
MYPPAKAAARPVVLMQGGIHAGEIDGKDAGFLALRELLEGALLDEYVADQVASELLQKSPKLEQAFNQKLASDGEFAANPQARLDFFYRAHASWDEAYNLYPVLQVDVAP